MNPKKQQTSSSAPPGALVIDVDYEVDPPSSAIAPRVMRRGANLGRETQKIVTGGDAGGSVILIRQIDPTQRGSVFAAAWSFWDSLRTRPVRGSIELIILLYVIGFSSAGVLSLLAARPVRISRIAIFDPTATGVMVASWFRPVIQRAADQMLNKQIESTSDPSNYQIEDGTGLFDAPTQQMIEEGE